MGDPWYDLAAVICGDELSAAESGRLVVYYLGRSPSEDESGALLDYCAVYRYLELLWYLALEHPAMDEHRQALAIEQLAKAVEAVSP